MTGLPAEKHSGPLFTDCHATYHFLTKKKSAAMLIVERQQYLYLRVQGLSVQNLYIKNIFSVL